MKEKGVIERRMAPTICEYAAATFPDKTHVLEYSVPTPPAQLLFCFFQAGLWSGSAAVVKPLTALEALRKESSVRDDTLKIPC